MPQWYLEPKGSPLDSAVSVASYHEQIDAQLLHCITDGFPGLSFDDIRLRTHLHITEQETGGTFAPWVQPENGPWHLLVEAVDP